MAPQPIRRHALGDISRYDTGLQLLPAGRPAVTLALDTSFAAPLLLGPATAGRLPDVHGGLGIARVVVAID